MPRFVTLTHVVTSRGGKRVVPKIGEVFDYTAEEVEALRGQTPAALRVPRNDFAPASSDDPTQGL